MNIIRLLDCLFGKNVSGPEPITVSPCLEQTESIAFPDSLSASAINMFVNNNRLVYTVSYRETIYDDPYKNLNSNYKRLGRSFYECDYAGSLIGGYIEYIVHASKIASDDIDYINAFSQCNTGYKSKNVYAIVNDGLLICIIDGYKIKLSSGIEYSLSRFSEIPIGLGSMLIKLITIHNDKTRKKIASILESTNAYNEKERIKKEVIDNLVKGI